MKKILQHVITSALLASIAISGTTYSVASKASINRAASYGDVIVTRLLGVHDGDTFKVDLADYPPIIGQGINVRINGIDTAELTSKNPAIKAKAQAAQQYLAQRLANVQNITLKNMRRDKFFRILADVEADGINIGNELLQQGLALPYDGLKKPDWAKTLNAQNQAPAAQ